MRRSLKAVLRPIAVLAVAAGLAAGQAGARTAVLPTLYVSYTGTNCMFTIVGDAGNSVATIAPGTYQIQFSMDNLDPCGSLPDFQLAGPGVLLKTPVDNGTGDAALYTVTFQPGSTYVAQDLHTAALSRITFTTQASGAPVSVALPVSTAKNAAPTTSTGVVGSSVKSAAALVARGSLSGTVSSSGKPTLAYKGKAVTRLLAGKYTLSVVDHDAGGGFIIQQATKAAKTVTGIPFVGKQSATISLTAGQWFFYPSFAGKKSYFIVVSAS